MVIISFFSFYLFGSFYFLFFNFAIVYLFSLAYHWLFYFVKRNQESHVCTNLVHKLFLIQSITRQPLSYFEKLVFKKDLTAADVKQKSKHRIWFTLTLNGFLYHVIFFRSIGFSRIFFLVYFSCFLCIWIFITIFFIASYFYYV